jgi:hypothetical protein
MKIEVVQTKLFNDVNIVKRCRGCNIKKNIEEFSKAGKIYGSTYRARCKKCINSEWSYRLMSTISSRTKRRVRPDGSERKSIYTDHQITKSFLLKLSEKQNGLCYWTNIPIDFTLKDKLRKPSLDRLDNSKGYTKDNVVLTTLFANLGRRDATIEEYTYFLNSFINSRKTVEL